VREKKENWISVNIHFFAECPRSGTRQIFFKNFKIGFAECPLTDTRQRIDLGFLEILCRVSHGWHSAKASLPSVQPWTLGKVYFYFLYFVNQTFCGMFLHYVDLHVPFWDNYNSVSIASTFSSFI
jgi:hypothetical protein